LHELNPGKEPVIYMNKKKAPNKAAPKRKRTPWNTSEILYAVFGYLTTREKPLILSRRHDGAAVAEILGKIVEANELPKAGNNYPRLSIPPEVDEITNVPATGKVINEPANPETQIMAIIRRFNPFEQNEIFKAVAEAMASDRKEQIARISQNRKLLEEDSHRAHKVNEDFLSIVKQ
jgi:hypothetical protein